MVETIYKGIAFPISSGPTGLPEQSSDEDIVRQALIQLILTAKSERIMRPDLGTSAQDFIFETNNEALKATVKLTISNAIAKWEPRVIISRVDVERDSADGMSEDSIIITVRYVVRATQQENVVSVAIGTGQGVV